MEIAPGILARGPWPAGNVRSSWSEAVYEPSAEAARAADAAIAALAERGSPAHDGLGARLVSFAPEPGGLALELQPMRWSLRLSSSDASQSLAAMCAVRSADGRWLAGRRAGWLATWPGRWALGAGGAVEPGEDPVVTLERELREEWGVAGERTTVEALVCLPQRMILLVGMAWLAPGAEPVPDDEHDAHDWWPADPAAWPAAADGAVREMGAMLAA
ncbi:MAG TPA: NUDIX domain-containing protein [Solirubrobacteraceae bacterium]|nr:NUDIX domain-containing protein [Solirubrobacteraceae bacterium]